MIGTHKLFGKDVKFQRLGLVVIDKEHRFGQLPLQAQSLLATHRPRLLVKPL